MLVAGADLVANTNLRGLAREAVLDYGVDWERLGLRSDSTTAQKVAALSTTENEVRKSASLAPGGKSQRFKNHPWQMRKR
jgi:hypothetical protein